MPVVVRFLPLVLRHGESGTCRMPNQALPCRPHGLCALASPWTEEMDQLAEVRSDAIKVTHRSASEALRLEIESLYVWSECTDVLVNVEINHRVMLIAQMPVRHFALGAVRWSPIVNGADLDLQVMNPGPDREFRFAILLAGISDAAAIIWPPDPRTWP